MQSSIAVEDFRTALAAQRDTLPCYRCSRAVTPQRLADRFIAYCHDCGHVEEWAAPRQPLKVMRKAPAKRCQCKKVCHFCRGAR